MDMLMGFDILRTFPLEVDFKDSLAQRSFKLGTGWMLAEEPCQDAFVRIVRAQPQ